MGTDRMGLDRIGIGRDGIGVVKDNNERKKREQRGERRGKSVPGGMRARY